MSTNDKERATTDNILPWINDGSYQAPEWQARVKRTMAEIRGDSKPGEILWDLNNKTVI